MWTNALVSEIAACAFVQAGISVSVLLLHVILPGRHVTGYCCDRNMQPLSYKLNGLLVLLAVGAVFTASPVTAQVFLYNNYYKCVCGANVFGVLLSVMFYIRGGTEKYFRCVTIDQLKDKNKSIPLASDNVSEVSRFYLGCEWNPRIYGVDIKMLLYIIGAVGLELNILSCCSVQFYSSNGYISNGLVVYAVMFLWFLHEYMLFERVHLYTYDLFAEKLGFKLVWGCTVFYPHFYCIGMHSLLAASKDNDLPYGACLAVLSLFLVGWCITRGANLQKYMCRTSPDCKLVFGGLIEQRTIPGTRILCSGFWGAARHFNYAGEILQGIALALPGTFLGYTLFSKIFPWVYPLFYITLFVTRQHDDDELCKKKYGAKWDEYCAAVPWKILPGIW